MEKRALPGEEHRCYRCGWRWFPRKAEYPRVCPHCHSNRWYDTKSDEELYWHWLEWAVGMHWFDLFRAVADVAKGNADQARAKKIIRAITNKAVARARSERPSVKRKDLPTE